MEAQDGRGKSLGQTGKIIDVHAARLMGPRKTGGSCREKPRFRIDVGEKAYAKMLFNEV